MRETAREPFYRRLFARSGFGYAALDAEGRIVDANATLLKSFAVSTLSDLPAFEAYQAFIGDEDEGVAPQADLAKALDDLKLLPKSKVMARQMLERIYSKAFVDRLANGEYEFVAVNPKDGDKTYARDEVDAALMLYNLFIIGPGMDHEAEAEGVQADRVIGLLLERVPLP